MNFVAHFKKGQAGLNKGLSTGLDNLDKAVNGIQRARIFGIAAPSKVGKSTLVDGHFVVAPYLLHPDVDIEWIYFSYEVDRIQKEFRFCPYFLLHDHNINTYVLDGETRFITSEYLEGKIQDKDKNIVKVEPHIIEALKKVYSERIIPLFGEYDDKGNRIRKGKIDFIDSRQSPSNMRAYLENIARQNGTIITEEYNMLTKENKVIKSVRPSGYIPNNPDKYIIIVTDHLRKIPIEKGSNRKDTIDKWIEHSVEMRNLYGYTFVHIMHTNRSLGDIDRIKFNNEFLYPTSDDIKDSGNLGEEADYMFTLFNPTDEKYNIKKHFGLEVIDKNNNLTVPYYRSLHLVESRHTPCPAHMQLEIAANINCFKPLNQGYGI